MKAKDKVAPEKATELLDWLVNRKRADELQVRIRKGEKKRRVIKRTSAGLSLALALAFGLSWGVPYWRDRSDVATLPATRQSIAFKDGSEAVLNAQTELRSDFRGDRREVHLERGEAFFSVAHDSAHPFYVDTPHGRVRVLGTKFNVRIDEDRVAVTLVEGKVAFANAGSPVVELSPSEQVESNQMAIRKLDAGALDEAIAWKDGRAVFHAETLEGAARLFARYHGKAIWIAPEAKDLHVGGSFDLDDLPGFFSAMSEMLHIKVVTVSDGSYRVYRR